MDRRERTEDLSTLLQVATQGAQADMWTAMPGVIQSFNPTEMSCVVQVSIKAKIADPAFQSYKSATKVDDPDGISAWDQLPLLLDCPVVFPSAGNCTLTFPIIAGDECLVIFASRCIDAWWAYGGIQNQQILRMHDLSDGFVIPGPKSKPRVIPNISSSAVQLRSDDGLAFIEINPSTHNIAGTTPSNLNLTIGGNVVCNVAGVVNVTAGGIINLVAADAAYITAGTLAYINAPVISMGSTGQTLRKLVTEVFQNLFNSHTHPTPSGQSSPPTQTMDATHLTSTVRGA